MALLTSSRPLSSPGHIHTKERPGRSTTARNAHRPQQADRYVMYTVADTPYSCPVLAQDTRQQLGSTAGGREASVKHPTCLSGEEPTHLLVWCTKLNKVALREFAIPLMHSSWALQCPPRVSSCIWPSGQSLPMQLVDAVDASPSPREVVTLGAANERLSSPVFWSFVHSPDCLSLPRAPGP